MFQPHGFKRRQAGDLMSRLPKERGSANQPRVYSTVWTAKKPSLPVPTPWHIHLAPPGTISKWSKYVEILQVKAFYSAAFGLAMLSHS